MYTYPKPVMTLAQLKQKLIDAGMSINNPSEADVALSTIGYYRLRGYSFHFLNPTTQQYPQGTDFSDILNLYNFDKDLSHLIFSFSTQIEIALRTRLVNALAIHNDALILNDPSIFDDKVYYWKNQASIASEIARSNDVFIQHNCNYHEGAIPLWAVVEIMSFGTLSKVIKTLKTGSGSSFSILSQNYSFTTRNGNTSVPSKNMLTSWIQSVSIVRNICAHNSRLYNRSINTSPKILAADLVTPRHQYNGLYEIMLAMKYLRPTDTAWNNFVAEFNSLLHNYNGVVHLQRLNFPTDWATHFQL